MWQKTIELYPKLAVIDEDAYRHMILGSTNEVAHDAILGMFLAKKTAADEVTGDGGFHRDQPTTAQTDDSKG